MNDKRRDKGRACVVPPPVDPAKRKSPLPSQSIKSQFDDPDAAARVAALVASDSYREADKDSTFLQDDLVRGARLGLDYMKPDLLMRQAGVQNTLVVFGGTRIVEPAEAQRRVAELNQLLENNPDDVEIAARLKVAKRILKISHYYTIAREFGAIVGRAGDGPADCRLTVMTGGGPGIMEAANRGAFDVGAKSIGLNITLPHEQFPNPYVSPGLCFSVRYFGIRKLHFLMRARALVFFPGGFGTLDELFDVLTLAQTRKIIPVPIVLVGESFWRRILDSEALAANGVIDPEDLDLFWYAESAQGIWDGINEWYQRSGSSLFCEKLQAN
ncbi:LOG family protein [Woeseia oceani]|uniref:AMP nucleosidase n=1 Tax=Woeseia oceani TaxID=1548547 RepID=A0A193LD84_9GAMM|nr:LOG family protein [Woeseia oceani]ANO50401.1 cytochrome D ubiquinol oxidase subunit II [Woeseia oceani]